MPTFTAGPDAFADRVDAEAAPNGTTTMATSTTNTRSRRRQTEGPTARDQGTPTRPVPSMVPPTVTTTATRPKPQWPALYADTALVQSRQTSREARATRCGSRRHLPYRSAMDLRDRCAVV